MGVNAFLDKRSCDLQNYEQIYHNTTISGVCGFGLQDIGDFVVVLCDNINLDLSFAYLIFKNNIKVVVLFFFFFNCQWKEEFLSLYLAEQYL